MIYVIAGIELHEGCRDEFLRIFKGNVPKVRAENGCINYEPTVDVDSGIPIQGELRENMVTIVEAWESLDALHAHLKAPHMLTYREQVKDLVKEIKIQVLEPA
jgi:quinol monooxygenase YgiN